MLFSSAQLSYCFLNNLTYIQELKIANQEGIHQQSFLEKMTYTERLNRMQ